MEQKMRQKRQNAGMVQANDLRVGSAKRPISGNRPRELHGNNIYYLNYMLISFPFSFGCYICNPTH